MPTDETKRIYRFYRNVGYTPRFALGLARFVIRWDLLRGFTGLQEYCNAT